LLSNQRVIQYQAPSQKVLLQTIERIADHFSSSDTWKKPFTIDWIDWNDL
jgi:hypothetical protein